VSWSLWPTFEMTDVSLANLPGGTRTDIARAERIEAQLSIPALLRRRVEVVKLTLTGPGGAILLQTDTEPSGLADHFIARLTVTSVRAGAPGSLERSCSEARWHQVPPPSPSPSGCRHADNGDAVRDDRHQGRDRHQHLTQNGSDAKLFVLVEVVDQHVLPQCD
jgi:hypothetical protein